MLNLASYPERAKQIFVKVKIIHYYYISIIFVVVFIVE